MDAAGGSVLTVERGMRVLRAFRSDCTPLSNAELVRRTGLSKATVSRLTSTLLQLGYLRHVPGGREFELNAAVLGIGQAYLAGSELPQRAEGFLQRLADRLDVSVALGIPDGLDVLYLGYRASRKVATLRLGVGSVLPMGSTAIGRACLWAQPERERKRLVAGLKRQAGAGAARLAQGLEESFAELERTGTCAMLGHFQRDVYAVALPVHAGRRRIVMGLSCGKADVQPDLDSERARIAPVLRRAAVEFEALLADFEGEP